MTDLVLLAPVALIALFLLLRGITRAPDDRRAAPPTDRARRPRRPRRDRPAPAQGRPIIVDGSNVLYWKDNKPRLETLQEVLAALRAQGYAPGVVFDANAGYLLTGRYQHHGALGRLVDLPEENVMVVPKGTPADPMILAAARDLGAPVLTNDRYRDWADAHPEIAAPGHLLRGGYSDGKLRLDLPARRT